MPLHLHASAGLARKMTFPEWDGYTPYEQHAAFTVPTAAWPAQIIPNTIFSGIAYRFPRLKWVFAETGIGAVSCAQTACDHEWERRQAMASWIEAAAKRDHSTTGLREFLVRAGWNRAPARSRRG